jgi:hypothetical protein
MASDKFPEKFLPAVEGLTRNQRRFFEQGGFSNPDLRESKRQVRSRIDGLMVSEHMESIVSSQHNVLNIFDELQKGSIILVDAEEGTVGRTAAQGFGCVIIAEVMRAIMERNSIPKADRRHAMLYIDEAQNFFRGDLEYFFTAARQCHVGGVFAFHDLHQPGETLRASIMANTGTKILSKRATGEAGAFHVHMGMTTTELTAFLNDLPPFHWACSVQNIADHAVAITAPPGQLEDEPIMSEGAFEEFVARNREKIQGEEEPEEKQEPPKQEKQEQPKQEKAKKHYAPWTEADELALADALHQLAVAIRRKNKERETFLRQHIAELEERKAASKEQGDDYWKS